MIIVHGYLTITSGQRDSFISASLPAVLQARGHSACRDFAVSADPINPDRVNVFELWDNVDALEAFRNEGPDTGLSALIESAMVQQREV